MTRKPQFYKRLFQSNIQGQARAKYPTFTFSIENAKETDEVEYNYKAPIVEYHQNSSNSCYFSSLASAFTVSG